MLQPRTQDRLAKLRDALWIPLIMIGAGIWETPDLVRAIVVAAMVGLALHQYLNGAPTDPGISLEK